LQLEFNMLLLFCQISIGGSYSMVENCINFLLSVSQHKVFKYYSKLLEEQGITPAQVGILTCIWSKNNNKMTLKEIGLRLHLEAPTVSGILDKMQKLELIHREVDPDNRRVVFVTTTEKSRYNESRYRERATEKMNKQVLQDFSSEETDLLKSLLTRLINSKLS
jgi:DNA-binding MarR family transcriptional regulator